MIEFLKEWIMTICTAIFFITAVQMILPDGSIKKYCNFVLGLIVFVVMINPIIKIFDSKLDVNNLVKESMAIIYEGDKGKNDYTKYRDENITNSINNFKNKLEKQVSSDLESSFKGDKYKTNIDISYDDKNNLFVINSMDIGINDGSIERIKKIQIGQDSIVVDNQDNIGTEKENNVKNFISTKYNIDKNKISIYKANVIN